MASNQVNWVNLQSMSETFELRLEEEQAFDG